MTLPTRDADPSVHSVTNSPPGVAALQRRPARGLLRLTLAAALAAAAGVAAAAPESGADAVARFLAERGLGIEASAAPAQPASGLIDRISSSASGLVLGAMNFIGVPYRRGGSSEDEGFDCSGFTRRVFASVLGLVLPRRSNEQAQAASLVDVKRDELKPGDLVFFNTLRRAFSHVGIYVGEGRFIHAPRSGAEVRIEDMRTSYWTRRFDGARRAVGLAPDAPSSPAVVTPASDLPS